MDTNPNPEEVRKCAYSECGGPIPARVGGRGPHRKYCTDECRLSVYRGGPKPEKVVACSECGTSFERSLGLSGAPKTVCSEECEQDRRDKYNAEYSAKRRMNNRVKLTTGMEYISSEDMDRIVKERVMAELKKMIEQDGN